MATTLIEVTDPDRQPRLLADVLATYRDCPDPRLRQIMEAAVRHLHAFVTEVGLTREEWMTGIEFLTAVGHMSTPPRQEFILLSDTLGVSSLVEMIGFDGAPGATENTVLGPFYVPGSPRRHLGDSIVAGPASGTPLLIRGQVIDLDGRPVAGAVLDVWQASPKGTYAVEDPTQDPVNMRGVFEVGDDGAFEFRTLRPVPYQIPHDGPVGRMLARTARHPWRAAHIHVMASAPGYKTLTTHIFDADSEYLNSDAVFGVRDSLLIPFVEEGGTLTGRFDIVLEPSGARLAADNIDSPEKLDSHRECRPKMEGPVVTNPRGAEELSASGAARLQAALAEERSSGGQDPDRVSWLTDARSHLRGADPVLARLIDDQPDFDPRAWMDELPAMDLFGALLFQITGQQLSVAATRRTLGRIEALFGGHLPSPAEVLAVDPESLRQAGLSWRKINTLRDLAARLTDGRLDANTLSNLPDDDFLAALTAIPGIGPWTAQGALLVALRREDVVLPGDLALRKSIRAAYGLDSLPTEQEVLAIAEKWRPYRSLATSYLFSAAFEPTSSRARPRRAP